MTPVSFLPILKSFRHHTTVSRFLRSPMITKTPLLYYEDLRLSTNFFFHNRRAVSNVNLLRMSEKRVNSYQLLNFPVPSWTPNRFKILYSLLTLPRLRGECSIVKVWHLCSEDVLFVSRNNECRHSHRRYSRKRTWSMGSGLKVFHYVSLDPLWTCVSPNVLFSPLGLYPLGLENITRHSYWRETKHPSMK